MPPCRFAQALHKDAELPLLAFNGAASGRDNFDSEYKGIMQPITAAEYGILIEHAATRLG